MSSMNGNLQPPLMQSSSFGMPPRLQVAQNGTLKDTIFKSFRVKVKKEDDVVVQLPEDGGKVVEDKDVVTVLRPDKGGEGDQDEEEWFHKLGDIINDLDSFEKN